MKKRLTWPWQLVFMGTAIQIVHFYMHGVQVWHWLTVDRSSAYMTPIGWHISDLLGALVVGQHMCGMYTKMVGMQWMHLILNAIFVATLLVALKLAPSKYMRWALAVELMHLGEHIALTSTYMMYGSDYGWSNLFGYATVWFGQNAGIGYKVWWHFLINFVPTWGMLYGISTWRSAK